MSERKRLLSRSAMVLADMVLFSLIFLMIFRQNEAAAAPPFPVWAVWSILCLWFNTLIRRRGGTVNSTLVFTAAAAAAMGAVLLRALAGNGITFWSGVTIFSLGAGTVIHGGILVHENWQYNQQSLYLDGLILSALFLLLSEQIGTFSDVRPYLIWNLLVLALTVLVLILYRTQDTGVSAGGPVLLLMVLGGAAWFGGTGLQGGTRGIAALAGGVWRAAVSLLKGIGRTLLGFLNWLMALFPASEGEMLLPEPSAAPQALPETLPEVPGPDPRILAAAAILVCLLVVLWILRRFRGLRWQFRSSGDPAGMREERRQPQGKLRKFLADWLGRISFALRYLRHRNSPEGLLTRAERISARKGMGRNPGESAPAFLRRIARTDPDSDDKCLLELAQILEETYYSKKQKGEAL